MSPEHPAELHDGDLPDQSGRAAPFGLVAYVDETCTCDVEHMYTHPGVLFVRARTPDPHDPCPHPGHDIPEIHRH